MEFFIHYYTNTLKSRLFYVNPSTENPTVKDVIDLFIKNVGDEFDEPIDTSKFRVYVIDAYVSLCPEAPIYQSDLSISIFSLPYKEFDLFLTQGTSIPSIIYKPVKPSSVPRPPQLTVLDRELRKAEEMVSLKNYRSAFIAIQEIMKHPMEDPRIYHLLVRVNAKARRFKQASEDAANALLRFPNDFRLQFLLAKVKLRSGQPRDAIDLFNATLQSTSAERSAVQFQIAKCLFKLNEPRQALEVLNSLGQTVLKYSLFRVKTLIALNLFAEAIEFLVATLWAIPYHLKLLRFIGDAFRSRKQVEVFVASLGDLNTNPKMPFFLAWAFHIAGSMDIAHGFFEMSIKNNPSNPTIHLAALRNMVGRHLPVAQIAEASRRFFGSCTDLFGNTDVVLPADWVSDFELNLERPRSSIVELRSEPNEPQQLSFAQIDSLAYCTVLFNYLFCNGFVSTVDKLWQSLMGAVRPYLGLFLVQSKTFLLFAAVCALSQSIPLPLPLLKQFFIIGDIHSLALAWTTFDICGQTYLAHPLCIEDLSISVLAKRRSSPQKKQFRSFIKSIGPNSPVMLCFGEVDCLRSTAKKVDRMEFDSFESAFDPPVSQFVSLLEWIIETVHLVVFVHPVPPVRLQIKQFVPVFNRLLKERLELNAVSLPGVEFLDFFGEMMDNNHESLRPVFLYHQILLSPEYAPYVQREIARRTPTLLPETDPGRSEALLNSGNSYANGTGVEKDDKEAVRLYQMAVECGNSAAMVNLGTCYANGNGVPKDLKIAIRLYSQAADLGDLGAMVNLGNRYANGSGVSKDLKRAISLYRKAAGRGHSGAMVKLGNCYANGNGVSIDLKRAISFYRKAADRGHSSGICNLAICYANGTGVEKDDKEAVRLYQMAVECGHLGAMINLGNCYTNGNGVSIDLKRAIRLYSQAAEGGHSGAMFILGNCYANGNGVTIDLNRAINLYHQAAEGGHLGAMFSLGNLYRMGKGLQVNMKEAYKWYAAGAARGHHDSASRAAWCLSNGFGVEKNQAEANRLNALANSKGTQ
jgi:TPR repeat protein